MRDRPLAGWCVVPRAQGSVSPCRIVELFVVEVQAQGVSEGGLVVAVHVDDRGRADDGRFVLVLIEN